MTKLQLLVLPKNATKIFAICKGVALLLSLLIIIFPSFKGPAFIYDLAIFSVALQGLTLTVWFIFHQPVSFNNKVAALIAGVDLTAIFAGLYVLSAGSMLFMTIPVFYFLGAALLFNKKELHSLAYFSTVLLIVSTLLFGFSGMLSAPWFKLFSQFIVYGLIVSTVFWGKQFILKFKNQNEQLEKRIRQLQKEKDHYKRSLILLQKGSEELSKNIKRREIEIQNILTISEQIQIGKDSKDILRSFLLTALGQMGSSHAFIMAKERKNQNYWGVLVEKGLRSLNPEQLRIYLDSNIITLLRAFKEPIILKELPRDNVFADELNFLKLFEDDVACPIYIKNKIIGMVVFGPKVTGLAYTKEEFNLISVVANQSAFILEQVQQSDEYRDQFARTVRAMLYAMEAKFFFNRGHLVRTANYVSITAKRLGFQSGEIRQLGLGTLLHDIGKTAIDDRYLLYNKSLSNTAKDEKIKERILTHTIEGGKILKAAGFNNLMIDMAVHHHEYFNGKGYPHRLGGEELPMETRILAVCNAYDAMTSERPYRKALSEIQAMEVLKHQSGQQFDPEVVKAFLDIIKHVTPRPTKH